MSDAIFIRQRQTDKSLKNPIGKTKTFLLFLWVFATLWVPRVLSLDAHWSSDESMWLMHSSQFMSAVKKREFSETLIDYHPGVTTMWVAGTRIFFTDPGVNVENLARARMFISIGITTCIVLACLLIHKLFRRTLHQRHRQTPEDIRRYRQITPA